MKFSLTLFLCYPESTGPQGGMLPRAKPPKLGRPKAERAPLSDMRDDGIRRRAGSKPPKLGRPKAERHADEAGVSREAERTRSSTRKM